MNTAPRTPRAALILSLALLGATPLWAQDDSAPVTADTVLATVNGTPITLGHVIVARAGLPDQYQQLPDQVLFQGLLDQLIQQTALAQTVTAPDRATAMAIDNQRSGLLANSALARVADAALTEEAIAAAYEARYANAAPEREFDASHILVETEEAAQALKAQLDGGADFATLAQENSIGPSGPNGGALGWFGKGMMVPEFENAVLELEVGQVSAPVQTQFGWHVVRLNDARDKPAPTLDEVRAELQDEIGRGAVEGHIASVMEGATVEMPDITVDAALLRNDGLLAQ